MPLVLRLTVEGHGYGTRGCRKRLDELHDDAYL